MIGPGRARVYLLAAGSCDGLARSSTRTCRLLLILDVVPDDQFVQLNGTHAAAPRPKHLVLVDPPLAPLGIPVMDHECTFPFDVARNIRRRVLREHPGRTQTRSTQSKPSAISHPFFLPVGSRMIVLTSFPHSPCSSFLRYFGIHTAW